MKHLKLITGILLLFLVFIFFYYKYNKHVRITEQNVIYKMMQDSVKIWKDKDNINHAKINVLESSNTKNFLNLQTKDKEILDLQKLVKEYKSKLKNNGSSATIIKGDTKFDTIYISKPEYIEILGNNRLIDSINNKWIHSTFGFTKDSTIYKLKVRNEYSVIIGSESQGLFKPKKSFAEVINYNIYSDTKSVRTFQIKDNRKRNGNIWIYTGLGIIGGLIIHNNIK